MPVRRIAIYGGRGCLGSSCVNFFRVANWWVTNIDFSHTVTANLNILVPKGGTWLEQERHVVKEMSEGLNNEKLDAIVCVAGGWVGGNARDVCKTSETAWRQSVIPSTISASLASKFLAPGGMLILSGARSALTPHPHTIGYGMAKSAVHHLTKSLSCENSGMPENSTVVAILPNIINTDMNRQSMPKADTTSWTPPIFFVNLIDKWLNRQDRPPNGSLVTVYTEDNVSEAVLDTDMIVKNKQEKLL